MQGLTNVRIVIAGTWEAKVDIFGGSKEERGGAGGIHTQKDVGRAPPGGWRTETAVRIVFIDQAREGKETGTQHCALCFFGDG